MNAFKKTLVAAGVGLTVAGLLLAPAGRGETAASGDAPVTTFEKAVEIIKRYETLHKPRHWPLVGYGHMVLRGEKFSRNRTLSETEADALLRKDLLKNCAVFREFGKDSLILGVLAYNIGSGAVMKSSVVKKLRAGDRNIRDNYLAHCRYRGKAHAGLRKRRIEEFETLFDAPFYPVATATDTIVEIENIQKEDV